MYCRGLFANNPKSSTRQPGMATTSQGWVAVVVGTLFWGFFAVPMKAKAVQDAHLHPTVFQIYMSSAVFLSSCCILSVTDFVWTWWGVVGGFVWVVASLTSIAAVNRNGVASSQGIWGGVICIVSFIWGAVAQPLWADGKCVLENTGLAVFGLALLVLGIAGIAIVSGRSAAAAATSKAHEFARLSVSGGHSKLPLKLLKPRSRVKSPGAVSESASSKSGIRAEASGATDESAEIAQAIALDHNSMLHETNSKENSTETANNSSNALDGEHDEGEDEFHDILDDDDEDEIEKGRTGVSGGRSGNSQVGSTSGSSTSAGLMFSIATGVVGGSFLVPSKLAPSHAQGLAFSFSFATGSLMAAFIALGVQLAYERFSLARKKRSNAPNPGVVVNSTRFHFHWRVLLPCLSSGVLWNGGNVSSVVAASSPLGLTVAFPLMQNAMVIGGILGITVMKEIQGRKFIAQFFASVVVVVIGAFFLGRYGSCKA
eukprot:c18020_g1_i1.p1 GENE.c18020_g1_i1~~c18020_g1_i1.p1  ORF type:complete len:485 (+),score=109.85 c18020_g1_i1:1441-2895(+)